MPFHITQTLPGEFTVPFQHVLEDPDALVKAKTYGQWNGLDVIAIGPKGGKIVGYDKKGKAIYAGSSQANKLAAQKNDASGVVDFAKLQKTITQWLDGLGIPTLWPITAKDGFGSEFLVQNKTDREAIESAFGIKSSGGKFKTLDVKKHIGSPLVPSKDEQEGYAAAAASGEADVSPFPKDLGTLKYTGETKGSHGGKVFKDEHGNRYLFKAGNSTIARAEEAASRLANLLIPGKVQNAKYVKLNGVDGTLIRMFKATKEISPEHGSPTLQSMQEHFDDIVQHHVVDWVLSNHDAHGGNFIIDGKSLLGIDKGQSFKAFVKETPESLPMPGKFLSKEANPNPSKQIYGHFWQALYEGKIKGDPVPAAQAVLTKLSTLSPEQVKAIVAPYVKEAAEHDNISKATLEKRILQRVMGAKGDWETFLSAILKTPTKVQNNFDTMPDGGGKEVQKFTIPGTPEVKEDTAPTSHVTGWPQKQGKVLVTSPGTEWSSGVKGFKGYPGKGYEAEVDYKGQNIKFQFIESSAKARVKVTWPDGEVKMFESPNKASDAVLLKEKGLPLHLNAVQKKEKGIAYPAKTLLNIKAFDFTEQGAPPPPPPPPKEVKQMPALSGLKDHPSLEIIHDYDSFPTDAVEMVNKLLGNEAPASWKDKFPPPGVPFKYELSTGELVLAMTEVGSGPEPTVHRWILFEDGDIQKYEQDALGPKLYTILGEAAKKMGSAVSHWYAKDEKVPGAAPDKVTSSGPMEPVEVVTVQKKFPWGKAEVGVVLEDDGTFTVTVPKSKPGGELSPETTTHKTISSAAKHAWVHTKGYPSVKEYEEGTGKKAPGVNWAFFGIKPGKKAKAPEPSFEETMAVKEKAAKEALAQEPTPSEDNFKTMPPPHPLDVTKEWVDSKSEGDLIIWTTVIDNVKTHWSAQKVLAGSQNAWSVKMTMEGKDPVDLTLSGLDIAQMVSNGKTTVFQGAIVQDKPSAPKLEGMQMFAKQDMGFFISASDGMKLSWHVDGKLHTAQKITGGGWSVEVDGKLTTAAASKVADMMAKADQEAAFVTWPGKLEKETYGNYVLDDVPSYMTGGAKSWGLKIKSTVKGWLEHDILGKTMADKSPAWASWVPPPGVFVEGMVDGKVVWFITSISGYGPSGKTNDTISFSVLGEGGEIGNSSSGLKDPEQALKEAFDEYKSKAGIGSLESYDNAFQGFFSDKPVFPPGSNIENFKELGAANAKSITTMPDAMTPEVQNTPVVTDLSFQDAWQHLPEVKEWGDKVQLKVSNKKGHHNIVLKLKSTDDAIAAVQKFAETYGLTGLPDHPKVSYGSAFFTFSSDQLNKMVGVQLPAKDVPSIEVATGSSPNNFQTMPDSDVQYPTKISPLLSINTKEEILSTIPEGSTLTLPTGEQWKKTAAAGNDSIYTMLNAAHGVAPTHFSYKVVGIAAESPWGMGNYLAKNGGAVITLPGNPEPKLKTLTQAPKPAPVKWKPPPPDPVLAAKKAWSKESKPASGHTAKVLSYAVQKMGHEGELYARETDEFVILGDGTESFKDKLAKLDLPMVQKDSPFGPVFLINKQKLIDGTPEAGTIKGPNGVEYPVGTTFEESPAMETIGSQLPTIAGFTKHQLYVDKTTGKADDKFVTMKFAGIDDEQMAQAKAGIQKLKEWGIEYDGEPWKGGSYTMFGPIDVAKLDEKIQIGTKVQPKIPEQPKPIKQKSLGIAIGAQPERTLAENNRSDLQNPELIKPTLHGASIRFGAGGVLMDGQLRMHRIKRPDGVTVHRFVGELTKDTKTLDPYNRFHFGHSAHKIPDKILQDGWKAADFDEETGTYTMSGDVAWQKGNNEVSSGKNLENGASVHVFDTDVETLRRTFVVDVPVGQDAEKALAEAMEKLDVNVEEAMAEPDELDEEILKLQQLYRSTVGPMGFREIAKLKLHTKSRTSRAAGFRKLLKGKQWTDAQIDAARLEVGADGFHHVIADDLDAEIKQRNVRGIVTGISVEGMVRALEIQKGYGGQAQTLWTGNTRDVKPGKGTTSAESDMLKGGGYGKFFRIISDNVTNVTGVASEKPKLVFHPRVLKKTNWYAHNGDAYGSQREPGRGRRESLGMGSSSNEVMVENVSPLDAIGMIVESDHLKQKAIGLFNKLGVTEVNGVPLDKFIVVGSHYHDLDESIDKMPGLKEAL